MDRWWLVIGSPENWQQSFEHGNFWGLKEIQRSLWEHLNKGDRFLIYVSAPVSGIVGYATLANKFIQTKPFWPEEVVKNEVIWPLALELHIDYCQPQDKWKTNKIVNEALLKRVHRRQMLQMLEDAFARDLIKSFPPSARIGIDIGEIPVIEAPPSNLHEELVEQILLVGRLQNFIAEKEYDMEGFRLDVVWRRVARAVPAYVFEVHIAGDPNRALAKLKHAFDIWNSNIYLVSTLEERNVIDKLLAGLYHEIKARLNFIEASKFKELASKKKVAIDLEKELGIL